MNETAYERVIRLLREQGCKVVERGGNRASATCPHHEDHNPSMGVTDRGDRVLIACMAGCDTRDIVADLGITLADLFNEPPTYDRPVRYVYDNGRVAKRWYRDGKKAFAQDNADRPSVLYHAGRLADTPDHRHVFLVEGEEDVHTLEANGIVATTAPQGADSFHKVDVTPLSGRLVVCVVDRPTKPGDVSGDKWAAQVQAKLDGVVKAFRFVQAARGKDATDHFAAGLNEGDFEPYLPPLADTEPESKRVARLRSVTYRRSELAKVRPSGWLVRGVLTRASLTLLAGKFGTYKSFVSIALAASVATGRPFLGHEVDEVGPVIYIAAEGLSGVRGRFEAWEAAHNNGIAIPDDRLIIVGTAVNLGKAEDVDYLRDLCGQSAAVMTVWDTLHRCSPGVDENSSQETGQVVETLASLREEFDCAQTVNHHTGHSGTRARGSSALEDDFDNTWVIKLGGDGEDRSADNQRTMEHRKVKDGELSPPVPLGLTSVGESAYVDRTVPPAPRSWLVTKAYAARLDEAGAPRNLGRDKVTALLKELGVVDRLDHNTASAIATLRKSKDYVPSTLSADV